MATYSDPYDLEQDAFTRAMDPNRNQAQSAGPPAAMADPIAPPAALAEPPPMAPQGPVGNGMDARDALGGYNGPMPGFRTDDYGGDVKARNSMKNTFGRIASRYGHDAAGLESLMKDPDFLRYFPQARLGPEGGRGGVIDFGGSLSDFESGTPVGAVDVLQAFDGSGANGWQWIDQADMGSGGGGQAAPQMGGGGGSAQTLPANDIMAKIQEELMALIHGQPSGVAQNSFLGAMK